MFVIFIFSHNLIKNILLIVCELATRNWESLFNSLSLSVSVDKPASVACVTPPGISSSEYCQWIFLSVCAIHPPIHFTLLLSHWVAVIEFLELRSKNAYNLYCQILLATFKFCKRTFESFWDGVGSCGYINPTIRHASTAFLFEVEWWINHQSCPSNLFAFWDHIWHSGGYG